MTLTNPLRTANQRRRLITAALVLATGLAYGLLPGRAEAQSKNIDPDRKSVV